MAVDANIIIAERIAEQLKKGDAVKLAVNNGYKHAFSSVLDGNVTTAIVAIISGALICICVVGIFTRGVKLDTQFTGGVVLDYSISQEVNTLEVKEAVQQITNRPVTVQTTENQIDGSHNLNLTLAGNGGMSPEEQKEVTTAVEKAVPNVGVELSQTYVVEPYIGEKALKNSEIAIALSIVFMLLYVWIRFSTLNGLSAGITAIIALLHDAFVVFMTFVVFGIPLNDAFVAVILTIIGYSINDTIVLYDRIRENKKEEEKMTISQQVNLGISQTLARSVNTSFTTGMCVLIILVVSVIFQITSIREFALPMLFGLISGCYSSVCIASILWAVWES